jgi:hypothetical protein
MPMSVWLPPHLHLVRFQLSLLTVGLMVHYQGLYAVMAGMTVRYLLRRPKDRHGWQLTLYYTFAMLLLTIANYYTSAKSLEAMMIEVPADTPEARDADSCGPTNLAGTVVSIVQVLLSDGLMVRSFSA